MQKRFYLTLSILIVVLWFSAACSPQLKMVARDSYGTPTLTPFLHKATYTSTSTPMEVAGGGGIDNPVHTETVEPESQEETNQVEITETESPSPSPEADPSDPTATKKAAEPTGTPKPTKPPATAKPTKPPADTYTPKPPADTNTPKPPADTNTPEPPADTNTPKPPTATDPPGECVFSGNSAYENEVINLINQERTSRGLTALTKNSSLTQAARTHSQDMACTDTWSHTGSDGSTLGTRLIAAGYSYSWAAENIAASSSQYFSASSVVNMWMNSTGHRNNILSSSAVHIGVGFRYAGDVNILSYDAYYTADFGAPR